MSLHPSNIIIAITRKIIATRVDSANGNVPESKNIRETENIEIHDVKANSRKVLALTRLRF